ncbi:hypothetical protein KC930_01855 [Candidatus Saccharibacteria bacterium]|nr:hypothetical protein [Candidatus Saccharibacteria bacterium]
MLHFLLTATITLSIVAAPLFANLLLHKKLKLEWNRDVYTYVIPILSGLIYILARHLPEPNITNESGTLAQHFVGGGFISALYMEYLIKELKFKIPFFGRLLLLYPFVSMMGVTNELLEFSVTKLHIYAVDGTDVWWDLFANTLGAYSLFFIYEISKKYIQNAKK